MQVTLAGNISLNTKSSTEFGQGFTATTACSGENPITVTPASSFSNASASSGVFYLSSVKVSDIPSTCQGDDFTINAYGNTSSTPLPLFNSISTNAVVFNNLGTYELGVGTLAGTSITSGTGTFTIIFDKSSVFLWVSRKDYIAEQFTYIECEHRDYLDFAHTGHR